MKSMGLAIKEIKEGIFNEERYCHPLLLGQCAFISSDTNSPSGLSCLEHAFALIKILICLDADSNTINSALLYSMVEYGDLPCDDLDELDSEVFNLVNGLQKMSALNQLYNIAGVDDSRPATEAMRKMMLAMVHDGRTVLIKLAEQVVILLHSKNMSEVLQERHASETMMIYAPLANRLGLSALKWQLEDLAFKIQNPDIYQSLSKGLNANRVQREKLVRELVNSLTALLKKDAIEIIDCYGRAKHIFSLYKKMHRKNLTLQEIYDAIALRVIVADVDQCYQALSIIHETWEVILQEFDDYVANPKKNGYQSIHTAIIYHSFPVEIQIRTKAMHDAAELGFAAHWLYKEGGSDFKNKSSWLAQLTNMSPNGVDIEAPSAFEQHAIRLFQDRVFVFTPNGEIKDLVNGATALDFAYAVHSQVGHKCRGVKINGAIAPIKTILKNGDRIEVLTNKLPNPSKDWLNPSNGYLKTAKARAKVANWLRLQDDRACLDGQHKMQKFCRRNNIDYQNALQQYLKKHNIKDNYLFYRISTGELRLENIFKENLSDKSNASAGQAPKISKQSDVAVLVSDITGVPTTMAACCYPIPGDAIQGFLTHKRGVVVHITTCKNLKKVNPDKLIDVTWSLSKHSVYEVRLNCSCYDYMLANDNLQSILLAEKIRLTHLKLVSSDRFDTTVLFEFSILISNNKQLEKLLAKLMSQKNIINVWR